MFVPPVFNYPYSEGPSYQSYMHQQAMPSAIPNPAGIAQAQVPQASQAQQVPSSPPPNQQTPRTAVSEPTGAGGLVDSVRRKIRAAAGIYDPYAQANTANRYNTTPMNPHMPYPSYMLQREDPYFQQQHGPLMMNPYAVQQPSYPQMIPPQSPYSNLYQQQYYQPYAMPGTAGATPYLSSYNVLSMYPAQQPTPAMMVAPHSMYPYGMMSNTLQSPYDPGYYGAPSTPYSYPQALPYGSSPYTPSLGYGPMMSTYDPYYGFKRPYVPDRNYVSSVKDLWQSDIA
ncbi:hypothetical protein EC973_000923 [Apophysomyces ossiformis]|uniref:Uncharacterized protein n=1 Tax=Apophysomyces ossiformis TaxID=679940 RepID=A0A8H7BL19_9FUNG|nr:hypothetical protein EC973_000923 [Apophysomyces ossiformis]